MRRILLTTEYKGTAYRGWQIQKEGQTIQGEITKALESICRHKINLCGSGRTDEGVHAMAQTAHFDCDCNIPSDKFTYCCNALLPNDIKILSSKEVPPDFHARFNVKKKTYIYKMYCSEIISPLRNELYAHIPYNLNTEDMQKACACLLGKHDFTCFMATGSSVTEPIRQIFSADIILKGDEIYFEISGSGFLRHMVRIITGTLIEIGRGKLSPVSMKDIIESKNRISAGATAPPCGLYLKSVEY